MRTYRLSTGVWDFPLTWDRNKKSWQSRDCQLLLVLVQTNETIGLFFLQIDT